ncbi:MAG TPA: ATP-binding protein [Bryobacteraceae bacterium]|jgi:serine/threonine-protein kinase RsbW|nr:ATP-binding protein [Bryobacteraceae bacterium]
MCDHPVIAELSLPSRLGFEKVAMSTAASVAGLMGFSNDRVDDLKTAVAEACINAMEHGNQFQERLAVAVTLTMGRQSLEVTIEDHGTGVNWRPATPDMGLKMGGAESARGMGLFLIQTLVDEVEFVCGDSRSHARLVIYLNGKESGHA